MDRYIDRPNLSFKRGKYSILDKFCFADFVAFYTLDTKTKDYVNDNQPEIFFDDVACDNSELNYPKLVPLMTSTEKMRCRNVKRIIRYHTPNALISAEAHAHHLLMLFFPFRKESDLMSLVLKYVKNENRKELHTCQSKTLV